MQLLVHRHPHLLQLERVVFLYLGELPFHTLPKAIDALLHRLCQHGQILRKRIELIPLEGRNLGQPRLEGVGCRTKRPLQFAPVLLPGGLDRLTGTREFVTHRTVELFQLIPEDSEGKRDVPVRPARWSAEEQEEENNNSSKENERQDACEIEHGDGVFGSVSCAARR